MASRSRWAIPASHSASAYNCNSVMFSAFLEGSRHLKHAGHMELCPSPPSTPPPFPHSQDEQCNTTCFHKSLAGDAMLCTFLQYACEFFIRCYQLYFPYAGWQGGERQAMKALACCQYVTSFACTFSSRCLPAFLLAHVDNDLKELHFFVHHHRIVTPLKGL